MRTGGEQRQKWRLDFVLQERSRTWRGEYEIVRQQNMMLVLSFFLGVRIAGTIDAPDTQMLILPS